MSDELIISDGLSNGATWATYRRTDKGALHRVKSPKLPLREHREDAVHDLARWLAERAPVTRQDRVRRAKKLTDRVDAAWRQMREAYQPGVIIARKHAAQDLAAELHPEAWHELQLGLTEPTHPDKPMGVPDIRALAEALGWPGDAEQVLAAYGQGETS